jgi:peptidoglycan/LPS O-acetylase OafA/YrhL
MTNEELQSKTIDWLRFPLAVAVVFIHLTPGTGNSFSTLNRIDIYAIISTCGSYVLPRIAVPCFYLFSGFLFFYKIAEWNRNVYLKKVKSRFKTLLIPYILWNLIPILAYSIVNILKQDGGIWFYLNDLYNGGIKIFWNYTPLFSYTNILDQEAFMYGPVNTPLWFLRDLIVMAFLSPLIFYFVKYLKLSGIILLGIAFYTKIWFTTPGFDITAFFFFSLGAYFSIHKKNMLTEWRKGKIIWLFTALVTAILCTYYTNTELNNYLFPVFILSGTVSIVIVTAILLETKRIKAIESLSKTSFFIYAIHGDAHTGAPLRDFCYLVFVFADKYDDRRFQIGMSFQAV